MIEIHKRRCIDKPISISILPDLFSHGMFQLHNTIISHFAADETRGFAKVTWAADLRSFTSELRAEPGLNTVSTVFKLTVTRYSPVQPSSSETWPSICSAAVWQTWGPSAAHKAGISSTVTATVTQVRLLMLWDGVLPVVGQPLARAGSTCTGWSDSSQRWSPVHPVAPPPRLSAAPWVACTGRPLPASELSAATLGRMRCSPVLCPSNVSQFRPWPFLFSSEQLRSRVLSVCSLRVTLDVVFREAVLSRVERRGSPDSEGHQNGAGEDQRDSQGGAYPPPWSQSPRKRIFRVWLTWPEAGLWTHPAQRQMPIFQVMRHERSVRVVNARAGWLWEASWCQ